MTDSKATMQLPMDLIAPAIQAHVNEAVITALKGSDRLIQELVKQILGQQVDHEGKPSTYRDTVPYLTWVTHRIVRDAVKAAITEHLSKQEEAIKKTIAAEMRKSNSPMARAMVDAMTKGMADLCGNSYRLSVEIKPG